MNHQEDVFSHNIATHQLDAELLLCLPETQHVIGHIQVIQQLMYHHSMKNDFPQKYNVMLSENKTLFKLTDEI